MNKEHETIFLYSSILSPQTLKYQNDQASTKMDDAQDNPAGAFLLLEIILIIIFKRDDDERPFSFE